MIIFAFIFVVGLIIGSFLNVVILRTVSNESIIFPGSKCPKCQNPLKWYHNIPVLSYIFLRGKCAFCKEKISIQYPLVELLTGFIFILFGYLYFNSAINSVVPFHLLVLMFLTSVIASSLLIVISGTDFKEMQVSDIHTYSLIAVGVIYSIIIGGLTFFPDLKFGLVKWQHLFFPVLYTLIGIIFSFLLLEIIRRSSNFLLGTDTFGDGDSYIFAGIAGVFTALSGINDVKFICIYLIIMFIGSILLSVVFSFPFYIRQLVKCKNWSVIITLLTFIIYAPLYFFAGNKGLLSNTLILITATIILFIVGITLCFLVASGIKKNKENTLQIPFGPSLCLSGLIGLVIIPLLLGII